MDRFLWLVVGLWFGVVFSSMRSKYSQVAKISVADQIRTEDMEFYFENRRDMGNIALEFRDIMKQPVADMDRMRLALTRLKISPFFNDHMFHAFAALWYASSLEQTRTGDGKVSWRNLYPCREIEMQIQEALGDRHLRGKPDFGPCEETRKRTGKTEDLLISLWMIATELDASLIR